MVPATVMGKFMAAQSMMNMLQRKGRADTVTRDASPGDGTEWVLPGTPRDEASV